MGLLATIFVVLAISFVAVMGFYWMRDGSLQSAGAKMDNNLAGIDRTAQPLQDSLGEVGDGVKKTVGNATDGDDRT